MAQYISKDLPDLPGLNHRLEFRNLSEMIDQFLKELAKDSEEKG